MRRESPDEVCGRLAAAQHGVISLEQSRAAGLLDKARWSRVGNGHWERVLPGVFRLRGAPESWHQKAMALLLWAGPESALSHRSAAFLWGIEGFYPVDWQISVTGKPHKPDGENWIRLHCGRVLGKWDVCVKKGFRVTRPERTLLDLSEI